MLGRSWAAVLCGGLLVFSLAGCNEQAGQPGETASGSPTPNNTFTDGPGPPIVVPPGGNSTSKAIYLNGCIGVGAALDYPFPLASTTVPSGWNAREDVTNLDLEAFECQRISSGPFERGPVQVVWNYHDAAITPESCQQGEFNNLRILHGFWISDAEVAAWLNQTFAMPTGVGNVVYSETAGEGFVTRTWQLQPSGGATSEITIDDLEGNQTASTVNVKRIFWPNGVGGVSYFDMAEDRTIDNLVLMGRGDIRAPFLNNNLGVSTFATATAGPLYDASMNGPIVEFKDSLCAKPL